MTVNDTAHNANPGDFVIFSGAVAVGGNITADVLNQEYQIQTTTTNTYTVTLAQASDHTGSGGGSNTVGTYLYGSGLDVFVAGTGWGAGQWVKALGVVQVLLLFLVN